MQLTGRSRKLGLSAQTIVLGLACLSLLCCKEQPVRQPPASSPASHKEPLAQDKQDTPDQSATPATGRMWVERHISGGEQCREQRPSTKLSGAKAQAEAGPPGMKEVTQGLSFSVYDTQREPLAVCRACGCPAYAFAYRLLIAAADLQEARAAGFKPSAEPSPAEH